MSDTKLRDLERRWKETGNVQDEAAYLLERVRVGDLTRERLELAAYCGHEGARRATSASSDGLTADTEVWLTGLAGWGHSVCVRAHVILSRLVLPWSETRSPADGVTARAVFAAEKWLNEPNAENARAAASASKETIDRPEPSR